MNEYSYVLDAAAFSYDPDSKDSNLAFSWACIKYETIIISGSTSAAITNTTNCSESVLFGTSNGTATVSFATEQFTPNNATHSYDYYYEFEVTMYDKDNGDIRDDCKTIASMTINDLVATSNQTSTTTILDVSILAASTAITTIDKLRLAAKVSNVDDIDGDSVIYSWSEANGLLTEDEINEYRVADTFLHKNGKMNAVNSSNFFLILDGNVLMEDVLYEFRVNVIDITTNAAGEASISIWVRKSPSIVSDSFELWPDLESVCGSNLNDGLSLNNKSFVDRLKTFYSISIEANADTSQMEKSSLFYQFSYRHENDNEIYWFFDSAMSQNAFIDNVILPGGKFTIDVTVTDSFGSQVVETVAECNVGMFNGYSRDNCVDLQIDVLEEYFNENQFLSMRSRYLVIFQVIQATLLHLDGIYGKIDSLNNRDNSCSLSLFQQSLDILYDYFGTNSSNLCQSDYVVVCVYFFVFGHWKRDMVFLFFFDTTAIGSSYRKMDFYVDSTC